MAAELSSLSRRRAEDELGESEPLVEAMSARLKEELVRAAAIATNADVADGLRRSASMYDLWLLRFLRRRKYRVAEATANVVGYLRWINVSLHRHQPCHVRSRVPKRSASRLRGGALLRIALVWG